MNTVAVKFLRRYLLPKEVRLLATLPRTCCRMAARANITEMP